MSKYNLIIICGPLSEQHLKTIAERALSESIPVIYITSIGFYSTFSIQLPTEFPIVDTHPDPDTIQDLRLLSPWNELQAAEKELGDITQMSDHDHGHIPWLLLLLRYLEEWKALWQANVDKWQQAIVSAKDQELSPDSR